MWEPYQVCAPTRGGAAAALKQQSCCSDRHCHARCSSSVPGDQSINLSSPARPVGQDSDDQDVDRGCHAAAAHRRNRQVLVYFVLMGLHQHTKVASDALSAAARAELGDYNCCRYCSRGVWQGPFRVEFPNAGMVC